VAGLLLLMSGLLGGWKMSLLVWPGAALAFLGPYFGVPAVGPLSSALVSMAAGTALAFLGFFLFRD